MVLEDQKEVIDAEGRRRLEIVAASALRLNQLIDDLLKFSRLGRAQVTSRPVDMTALAESAAVELSEEYPGRTVRIDPLPVAWGDVALLRQVFLNLIGNGLKYSSKVDHPRVCVSGEVQGGEAVYEIEDNGVGFDNSLAHRLFGVFQRLHPEGDFPGTGVGLALVKRLIGRHGGRVWAESEPGNGASFRFTLPISDPMKTS